jgi:L-amino acid N-acyltransferase
MITIRAADAADLPEILDIYNEIILNTTAIYQYEIHTLEMRAAWLDEKLRAGYPVFVAEMEGGAGGGDKGPGDGGDRGKYVVGFSSFGPFRAWQAYKYTVENSVYVDVRQRGKGIGKSLLAPLIRVAKERDLHAIIAGIDATNEASIRLHASFGFEDVAYFRQVGYKFGRWLDLKFMELLLDGPQRPVEG